MYRNRAIVKSASWTRSRQTASHRVSPRVPARLDDSICKLKPVQQTLRDFDALLRMRTLLHP